MAQTAAGIGSHPRAVAWAIRCCAAVAVWFVVACGMAQAEPVRGAASFSTAGGYARLILKFEEDVETEAAVAGSVLIIRFRRPVYVPLDKLSEAVPDYVGSARRDPDGLAIRLLLNRKITVNLMEAGERVFVDLLPDSWAGAPPGLPQEVLRELSERARAAARALRAQRATAEPSKRSPVRVRASVMPTFVRLVFELPDGVGVSSTLSDRTLSLRFNSVLSFDLADAKVAAPPNIAAIAQRSDGAGTAVELALIGDVNVKSFREDKTYVVDIDFQQADKPALPVVLAPVAPPAPAPAASAAQPPPPVAESSPPQAKPPAAEQPVKVVPASPPKPQPVAVDQPAPAMPVTAAPARQGVAARAKAAEARTKDAAVAPPAAVSPQPASADTPGAIDVRRGAGGLRIGFTFSAPVAAALFRRANVVWLVLDAAVPVDPEAIRREGGVAIGEVSAMPLGKAQAIRVRLNRPQLAALAPEPQGWSLTFADSMQAASQPLAAARNVGDPARANVVVPLPGIGRLHRIVDPDIGDALMVVTAMPPARGFIRKQDFVDFSLLETVHGVVVQPNSDEVVATPGSDRVTLSRPGGLTLSPPALGADRASPTTRPPLDPVDWQTFKEGNVLPRLDALFAAQTSSDQPNPGRIELARFYMARGMYHEAKAMLDLVLAETKPGQDNPAALILHAASSVLMGRPDPALADLAHPALAGSAEAQLWRAMAHVQQAKWAEARAAFKVVELVTSALPLDLQRAVAAAAMRASLELKDLAGAARYSDELELIGVPLEQRPAILLMRGRLAEALGGEPEAQAKYREVIASPDRAAAAEARLLDLSLRLKREEISADDALPELETLAITWRGDGTEVRAQRMMQIVYSRLGRYGEAMAAARSATQLQANSDISRQAQDDAAELFSQLFLTSKGDKLPAIEALALFYEFRDLTPIGRRGDEMIRRLAERLVAVDLLDQASELLQYQVDNRLEGAARAQVASRLAMVYLMNRKPDRAIGALRATRIADLAGEWRQQRLLLEARAQSDIGRHELALEIVANIPGREAVRLRSDVYWASRRWRESAEQIELYLGERWRDLAPLTAPEKGDVIRAVVGYALAEDALGLSRFREKYAPLMSGDDRAAFDGASAPRAASSAQFAAIARIAASVDTLDGFLREMRTRFPDVSARGPLDLNDAVSTATLPAIVGSKRADAAR